MKTILIVDDQPLMITIFLDLLGSYFEEIRIFTAHNGEEAIKVVNSESVDLVITDLEMPIMSGFELLGYLLHNYPDINTIVVTGAGSPEIEEHLYTCGSFGYVEKPIKMEVFSELVKSALFPTASGHIKGINLSSFLQLLNLERKTCTVKVSFKSRKGYLYFKNGEIIDAKFEGYQGEIAIYEIFKWPNPEIEVENISSKMTRNIDISLNHILMESAKRQDEYRRDSGNFQRITLENFPLLPTETSKNQNTSPRTTGSFQRITKENELLDSDILKKLLEVPQKSSIPKIEDIDNNKKINPSEPTLETIPTSIEIQNETSLPKDLLEDKILRKWKFIESAFSDETTSVLAKYLEEEKTIPLQGKENFDYISDKVIDILNEIFLFSDSGVKGTFEYVNDMFGVVIVWDRLENYTVIALDGFDNKTALTWFRRKRVILEKAFLSD